MKLKSNLIDPYVGQKAEGKKIKFESLNSIEEKELKVFKFDGKSSANFFRRVSCHPLNLETRRNYCRGQ